MFTCLKGKTIRFLIGFHFYIAFAIKMWYAVKKEGGVSVKKHTVKLLALILAVCMLLSGCAAIKEYFSVMGSLLMGGNAYDFAEMTYVRPDLEQLQAILDDSCAKAETETQIDALVESIYAFYDAYDSFYTAQALAMIHYSKDMTNAYWEAEYNFCTENLSQVAAGLDRLYRALAKSPLRETLETAEYFGADYFDSYEGQSIFDETFTAMMDREAQLQNDYFAAYAAAGEQAEGADALISLCGEELAQILAELVILRCRMAQHAGYDSYPEFAYDFYHARDYSPAQATAYLADIRAELVPLYRQIAEDRPQITLYTCDEAATFDYVKQLATSLGGTFYQAFGMMTGSDLYDISPGANKMNASFETYISNYQAPYVFINPTETEHDKLTFAHEFGHFCNDYASGGSPVGVDVAEFFSQGLEYLSLEYGPASTNLTKLKMLDCLCVYVEQAAYASFEQQLYELPEEEVTPETITQLYTQVCGGFGLDGGMYYVLVTHFYTSPMYVISYVVSNDAALQLYQLEQATPGAGKRCLEENLDTMQPYFLAFLEEAGLQSPFAPGRLAEVKQTLQGILQ